MPIDFSDPAHRRSYSGRTADTSWTDAVREVVDPRGRDVVDLGCGGGIYTRAWHELGAATVVGVDSSPPILEAAGEACAGLTGVTFRLADAAATGLPGDCADVVFARALIHHLPALEPLAAETARLLRPGGRLILQDRSPEDTALPGAADHPRGWFFEVHPRLAEVERGRRHDSAAVASALTGAGFARVRIRPLWEIRRRYADREQYLADVEGRTGRSILHELPDAELGQLVAELRRLLPTGPVVERDRWTLWCADRR